MNDNLSCDSFEALKNHKTLKGSVQVLSTFNFLDWKWLMENALFRMISKSFAITNGDFIGFLSLMCSFNYCTAPVTNVYSFQIINELRTQKNIIIYQNTSRMGVLWHLRFSSVCMWRCERKIVDWQWESFVSISNWQLWIDCSPKLCEKCEKLISGKWKKKLAEKTSFHHYFSCCLCTICCLFSYNKKILWRSIIRGCCEI